MYKLKMNAVYAKFGENKENRTNVKFSNNEDKFKKLVGRTDFEDKMILEDDVNLLSMKQLKVYKNKPVYVANYS